MIIFFLACLIGFVAGLRALTAPAATCVAAHFGLLNISATPLAFLGYTSILYIILFLAFIELIVDLLPTTPSRKHLSGFTTRIVMGALCGVAISTASGNGLESTSSIIGGIVGIVGAVIGTLGGAEMRARLATAFGKDWPAALIEDLIAIIAAALFLIIMVQL